MIMITSNVLMSFLEINFPNFNIIFSNHKNLYTIILNK